MKGLLVSALLCLSVLPSQAGIWRFAWDDATVSARTYEMHLITLRDGQQVFQDRLVLPLAATQCTDAPAYTAETQCAQLCLNPGVYRASLRAFDAGIPTDYTNTVALTMPSSSPPCAPASDLDVPAPPLIPLTPPQAPGHPATPPPQVPPVGGKPLPTGMGNVDLAWDFPIALQLQAVYEVHIATLLNNRPTQTERVILPLPPKSCRQETVRDWTPNTLCGDLCLAVGEYSLKIRARKDPLQSAYSNVADLDLTVTEGCQGQPALPPLATGPAPPPPKASSKPGAVAGTAVVLGGAAVLAGSSTVGAPSAPVQINTTCVQWKIAGPCFCSPFNPCVQVEYFEPAWIVETVKQSGQTLIPVLGEALKAAFAATGVPLWGGGGAAAMGGAGQTNLQYNEVHVYRLPNLFGGPCSGCLPRPGLPVPHYASELDAVPWRTALAVPTPFDLLTQIGVWAPLYPRGGKVIHASEPVGSAVAAVRAMDIIRQPVGTPPHVDAHVVLKPGLTVPPICMQLASPRMSPCMPAGTPNALWESGAVSPRGTYVWIIWQKRSCCVNPQQATCGITLPGVGLHGGNWCELTSAPAP